VNGKNERKCDSFIKWVIEALNRQHKKYYKASFTSIFTNAVNVNFRARNSRDRRQLAH
jgi:hypothetical protein